MFGQHDDHANKDNDQTNKDATVQAVTPDSAQPDASASPTWQHSDSPLDAAAVATSEEDTAASPTAHDTPLSAPFASPSSSSADDLIDIKQQALSKLAPLVGHLDQSPEEKFRTTMMMIQASDDQGQVKTAYETALAITDEKTRAQALLDVINEINYFTQHHDN